MFEARDAHSFGYRLHEGSEMRMNHHFAGATGMPVAIQTWVLPPGGFEGAHRHEGQAPLQEFYQVISGRARMRVGGREHILEPGDSVLAAAGVDHDLHNIGDGELRVLTVWGPPGDFDMSGFGSHRLARQHHAASSTDSRIP
ncbi:cupin domain-containing protein [Glutamicibacter sp. MNS18]|uniref:cupin domain-containing protein n=1 Tax=Glutamicibacter sp. MNS18 TaxID=2989817 RepID=UPI002235C093|nr:cupin domain-containing protein [Glutamicibacter sp. MNS18]MCW4465794.1 cupin domain-containing protein [Glutamicibacter sp. MNS18]